MSQITSKGSSTPTESRFPPIKSENTKRKISEYPARGTCWTEAGSHWCSFERCCRSDGSILKRERASFRNQTTQPAWHTSLLPWAPLSFRPVCASHNFDWQAKWIPPTTDRREALIGQIWALGLALAVSHTEAGSTQKQILTHFTHSPNAHGRFSQF